MFRMDIDSPPISPTSRIVQRLCLLGVPEENFEQPQLGLVAYVKTNKFRVAKLVSAILPPDDEAVDVFEQDPMVPSLEEQFPESMTWLKWLMFESEPVTVLEHLAKMSSGQRGVCGAVWGNNDIAYRCRTCEHDPTCAICVPCFMNGNHKGHDYSVIYTGGGCCDCGDITAWKREGFCSKHKGAEQIQTLPEEYANSVGPVLDSLFLVWKKRLESFSLANSIIYADELTSAVVDMLLEFCNYSESLLSFISGRVLSSHGLLDILVKAESFLDSEVVKKLQELLLKLLSEPVFKYEFAKVFLGYYPSVVNEARMAGKDGVLKKYPLIPTFSVQILTVPTLTPRLVKEMNLLTMLLDCLGSIFFSCGGEDGRLQVNKWEQLYETTFRVMDDIRFVMSHSVVPKYVTRDRRDILRAWMKLVAFVQGMNPQKRETGIHIEEESENLNFPYALVHSIANIHGLLVAGAFSVNGAEENDDDATFNTSIQDFEDQDSLRHAKVGKISQESSVSSVKSSTLPISTSVLWLTYECLRAIENRLGVDDGSGSVLVSPKTSNISSNNFFALKRTLSKFRKGRYIFKPSGEPSSSGKNSIHILGGDLESGLDVGSTVSDDGSVDGEFSNELEALRVLNLSDWPDVIFDVSSQEISVHIPLHRLLASILHRALKRCCDENADPLWSLSHDFFGHVLGGCHPYGFAAFVMEDPLRVRVFCAQVQAGMWRKNGDAAIIACEWYHSVRWSEQGLELDLFLLQCCAALAPADLYVNRILERFGLSSYLSLNLERSSEYEPFLVQEFLSLIIQIIKERRYCGLTTLECLQRELIHKLSSGDATRSQLLKSLPRDLSKADQLQEVLDTIAVYSNPSGLNQGMYKLRLSYWKELDLYHPRWVSRDLQVVEDRYLRFCNVSALTSQLPNWTKAYHPLKGLARVATCKTVLQLVRAVLLYAVSTEAPTVSRAPDGVLLTALHLLSLSLEICCVDKESGNDVIPNLAFAGEEVHSVPDNQFGGQSLLSLLVLLMRKHKKESPGNFVEAGCLNLSSLIEILLKKFAELDSGCMTMLVKLAPEVVNQLLKSVPSNDSNITGSISDADKRKEKARARQAAIMEKMRAQQTKFLASVDSTADEGLNASKTGEDVFSHDSSHDTVDSSTKVICSLCHDHNSKNPLSYLVLLQKSRLLSLVDGGPPSWEQVDRSEKKHVSDSSTSNPSQGNTSSSSSEMISSSQLMHLVQNAVNEFASDGQSRDVNAFLEFIKGRFPSMGNIQFPFISNDTRDRTASSSLETLEERMYQSIRETMHADRITNIERASTSREGSRKSVAAESLLLGKYIAALSKETVDNLPSSSSSSVNPPYIDKESRTSPLAAQDGFGPSDCDGVYLSSCGHAVHQGCLDRYLSSLKERQIRRIVFEGGHIVDPEQGEFLCPVCRGLVNSVLPAVPGNLKKGSESSTTSSKGPSDAADSFASLNVRQDSLLLQQALSLLQSAADISGRNDVLKAFPTQWNGKTRSDLDSVFRVLCGIYFTEKDKIPGSGRVCHMMIMWDMLKHSLVSTEIAARSERTSLTPNRSSEVLYKELKSSSGFILSLLLKIVQSTRAKSSLNVLLRLRGIQLFADSLCSGICQDKFIRGGNMLCILENTEKDVQCPDIQFWARASDPVLAHDAFSSLMWILFCLPRPFLSCEESFLSFVHIFYVVSVTQAVLSYYGKHECDISEVEYHDCLITDISNFMVDHGTIRQYFVSNYIDPSRDIKDIIRSLTFPYLRRCALLWKLINSTASAPYSDGPHELDISSHTGYDRMDYTGGVLEELAEVEELENMFKIPPLDVIRNDKGLRSLVFKWVNHFSREFDVRSSQSALHSTPGVPFKLMILPHLYQDLLQRYIKQGCSDCGAVPEEPALCLLCGKLCSPNWKKCCGKNGCQTHAMACGAGIGVFLLIRRTTILLQRCARQAPWPSPYLDSFGEEDADMRRGKPLYLNEERYASLTHMVASHGLDRSSKVLRQTTIGAFFMH